MANQLLHLPAALRFADARAVHKGHAERAAGGSRHCLVDVFSHSDFLQADPLRGARLEDSDGEPNRRIIAINALTG
jgi:hypothetical protein